MEVQIASSSWLGKHVLGVKLQDLTKNQVLRILTVLTPDQVQTIHDQMVQNELEYMKSQQIKLHHDERNRKLMMYEFTQYTKGEKCPECKGDECACGVLNYVRKLNTKYGPDLKLEINEYGDAVFIEKS